MFYLSKAGPKRVKLNYYRRPLVECHGGDKEESAWDSATHLTSVLDLKSLIATAINCDFANLWVSGHYQCAEITGLELSTSVDV